MVLHYPLKIYMVLIVLLFLGIFSSIGYSSIAIYVPNMTSIASTNNLTFTETTLLVTAMGTPDPASSCVQSAISIPDSIWCNLGGESNKLDVGMNVTFKLPAGTINSIWVQAQAKTTTGGSLCELAVYNYSANNFIRVNSSSCVNEVDLVLGYNFSDTSPISPFNGLISSDNRFQVLWYDNSSAAEDVEINNFNITIDYTPTGGLNVTLWNTTVSSINITQDNTTIINASVVCLEGDCNNVNATFWYNFSNNNYPNVLINTTQYDKPFYNFSGAVIQLCGNMVENDQCNVSIVVNATGYAWSSWYINVTFNSSNSLENSTFNYQINITIPPVAPVANTKPNISTPTIIPSPVEAWDAMNCSVVASDKENVTLYINFTWYRDGAIQDAYNSLETCSNSILCYTGILVLNTSTSAGEGWNCTVQAWDDIPPLGLNSSWNNTYEVIQNITTNNVTLFDNPDPVNVTLDAKFQANYTDDNDNPIVNVSVCNIDFQIGAGWVGAVWMDWNGTSAMYEYTRSFPNIETVNVSTVCWEVNYQEQRNRTDIIVQAGPTLLRYTIETVNASNENYSIQAYPGNETLDIWWNVTDGNQKYVLPCIETGTPPSAQCQNLTNPIMRFTNVGSESFNISIRLNFTMIGNITVFANFSNYTSIADCSGWTLGSNNSIIDTTPLYFTKAMCVGNITSVWLYANFTDYSGDIVENFFNYTSDNG